MITKLEEIKLTKLNAAEYTQFLSNTINLITTATAEKLGLKETLFEDFKKNIAKLTDLSKQSKISKETQELELLDKQRDELVVYLLTSFKNERKSPLTPRKEAAEQLYILTKPYVGIQSMPYRQETQHIEGLLTDLEKPENKPSITTLGLTNAVEVLKTTNAKYKKLTADRTDSLSQLPTGNIKDCRKQTDEQYQEIVIRAFAQSVAIPTVETSAFITSMNQLIKETNTAYKQRIAQSKKGKNEVAATNTN